MKLFGSYTSPYVRHIRIVLAQTGQDCKFVETDYEKSGELSPARRVPFLYDDKLMLTDSASILRCLREKAEQAFFPDIRDYDLFLLVNTAMGSAVNLFLLEKDGITAADCGYLVRQKGRVDDILSFLDRQVGDGLPDANSDGAIRLGCFLSWALFRERISLEDHAALAQFQRQFESDPEIAATHPVQLS